MQIIKTPRFLIIILLRIVILSPGSIFAAGIARRLVEREDVAMVRLVDVRRDYVLEQVRRLKPSLVILDATDVAACQRLSVACVLNAVPGVTLIRVDPRSDQIVIFKSVEKQAARVNDIVAAFHDVSNELCADI